MVNSWQTKTGDPFGSVTGYGLDDPQQVGGALGKSFADPFGIPTPWSASYQTPLQRMQQQFNSTIEETMNAWWKPPGTDTATVTGTPGGSGAVTSFGGDWAGVDKWNNEIGAAAKQFGVPANALKALMKLESNGENIGENGAGAVGPMQVTFGDWGAQAQSMGYDLNDPADNIMMGAFVLKSFYDEYAGWAKQNNMDPWKAAFMSYYSGSPYNPGASDSTAQGGSGISAAGYADQVFADYQSLNGAGGSSIQPGLGGSVSNPGYAPMATIWGNNPNVSVSQGIGMTDFAQSHADWYAYSSDYSLDGKPIGHTGIDVAMPAGSALYSPGSGTVVTTGGTPYFTYEPSGPNVPGTGELRLEMDNGDIVILGHMQSIDLQVGQRVGAGMYVGRSGGFNGDHVHVEYRKKAPGQTASGYLIVDPTNYFGGGEGILTGNAGAGNSAASSIPGLPSVARPYTQNAGGRPFWMTHA